MSKQDYYTILGLAKDADSMQIKSAYRKLASKYHPDKFPTESSEKNNATAKFREAKEAYETLSDPEKKAAHDNPSQRFHNKTDWDGWNSNDDMDGVAKAFTEMFKHRPGNLDDFYTTRTKQNLYVITISLQDAYIGRTITIDAATTIHLPKGIRTGTKLFNGGKMFRVDVLPDLKFKRSNDDLLIEVEITAIEAIFGINAKFVHLDGAEYEFEIPAGMQFGKIVKLNKKGMKNPETDQYGDMLVRVSITVPKLSTEELELLKSVKRRETINL